MSYINKYNNTLNINKYKINKYNNTLNFYNSINKIQNNAVNKKAKRIIKLFKREIKLKAKRATNSNADKFFHGNCDECIADSYEIATKVREYFDKHGFRTEINCADPHSTNQYYDKYFISVYWNNKKKEG